LLSLALAAPGCRKPKDPGLDAMRQQGGLCGDEYITSLYWTVHEREPDPDGLAYWQGRYEDSMPRRTIALSFLQSPEWRGKFVEAVYSAYLGRSADQDGFDFYTNALHKGYSEEWITGSVIGSEEFFERYAESSHAKWVELVFGMLLGRGPTDAEFDKWTGADRTRSQIARSLLRTDEYRKNMLKTFYDKYLGRKGTAGGFKYWLTKMKKGTSTTQVRAGFLASDEYFDNQQFSECDASADQGNGAVSTGQTCGTIPVDGVCQGNVVAYCDDEDNQVYTEDCAADGGSCVDGWCEYPEDADPYFDDVGGDPADEGTPDDGPSPNCGGVTEEGSCAGSVLSYCDGAGVVTYDCAADGVACGDIGDGLFDCLY
jgi:hypothetical protein